MGPHKPDFKFPHRHNKDGSYDSICPTCFHTIATVKYEFELSAHELKHVCEVSFMPSKGVRLKLDEPIAGRNRRS
jgi:hypothetical protein